MRRVIATTILACCIGIAATAKPSGNDAAQLTLQFMKTTKLVAVADFSGPPDKFVPDKDPNSLQIVFLAKPEFGPSRVSDDGEVIFLSPDATDKEQQNLIGKAFDIRVQRRLAAQNSN
jgi:hypothetical protein